MQPTRKLLNSQNQKKSSVDPRKLKVVTLIKSQNLLDKSRTHCLKYRLISHEENVWNKASICCFSVAQLCPTLCNPTDCNTPGFPVLYHLPELAQGHVHWVSDDIQPSSPLSSPSPPALNLSQHQGLFQWVSSSHQVAKGLEFQHQSFQWIFRTDLLQDGLIGSPLQGTLKSLPQHRNPKHQLFSAQLSL